MGLIPSKRTVNRSLKKQESEITRFLINNNIDAVQKLAFMINKYPRDYIYENEKQFENSHVFLEFAGDMVYNGDYDHVVENLKKYVELLSKRQLR